MEHKITVSYCATLLFPSSNAISISRPTTTNMTGKK